MRWELFALGIKRGSAYIYWGWGRVSATKKTFFCGFIWWNENFPLIFASTTNNTMQQQSLKLNETIFLAAHQRQPMPSFFKIVKLTDKAVLLENNQYKNIWLPKAVLKYDAKLRYFYLPDSFRRKLEYWQLSRLQA